MSTDQSLNILVDVRARLDDLVKAQGEIKKLGTVAASTSRDIKSGFGSLFSNVFGANLAANAVSRMVSGAMNLITGSVREANQAFEDSRNLDISVTGYQKLRGVIRQSGGDVGALNQAIEKLNSSLTDARDPSSTAAANFRALGLDSLALEAKPVEDRFVALAQAVQRSGEKMQAWDSLGKIIGDRTLPRIREGLNQLAEDGFASVANSATEAETKGIEAIHALYDNIEQNSALFKSKVVEDFGSLLRGLGISGEAAKQAVGQGLSAVDVSRLRSLQSQRAAVIQLGLELAGLSDQNELLTNDPKYTDAEKKFWVKGAAASAVTLLETLRKIRKEMPLDVPNGETPEKRAAELRGYETKTKIILQSVSAPRSAYSKIKEDFENTNVRPDANAMAVGNPNYLSASQGLKAGPMEWVTQLGSTGQQVAGALQSSLGSAVSGISDGIYGWITGTKSFGEAMQQLGATVFQTIIQTIVQMGVQWLVTQTLMRTAMIGTNTLDQTLRGTRIAGAVTEGAATTAAMAPAAATASISSFGLAAILGIAALVAVMAAFGGFSTGGYTGNMGRGDVAGVVHGQEYVLNAAATSRLGTGFLDKLNSGTASAASAPVAFGGAGAAAVQGGGTARESVRNNHFFIDREVFAAAMQQDMRAVAHEVYLANVRKGV